MLTSRSELWHVIDLKVGEDLIVKVNDRNE